MNHSYEYVRAIVEGPKLKWEFREEGCDEDSMVSSEDVSTWSEIEILDLTVDVLAIVADDHHRDSIELVYDRPLPAESLPESTPGEVRATRYAYSLLSIVSDQRASIDRNKSLKDGEGERLYRHGMTDMLEILEMEIKAKASAYGIKL